MVSSRIPTLLACVLIAACTSTQRGIDTQLAALAPLQLDDRLVHVGEVRERAPTPDLLAVDQQMVDFVNRYTGNVHRERARLMTLHRAIKGPATLGVNYDPEADGTARDAFHRGTANCLAYASLFIALAREAGLDAGYQWLEVSPRWSREGDRVAVRLHVNALVKLRDHHQFMVDIDPLEARDVAGSRRISDSDAQALHHSNIAVEALAAGATEEAWLHAVRALELSPGMAHLWVNLGAIYRFNGQHREAERHYLYALRLDPEEFSAMNNLAILYGMEGRDAERQYWEREVASYRDINPYYHAWRGDEAAEAGHWRQAVSSYERALALAPRDGRLLAALGRSHEHLGELRLASDYLLRAIDAAATPADRATYTLRLEEMGR
jgi:Flp pilus assembly protein TadD